MLRTIVENRNGYLAHAFQSEGQGDQGLLRGGFRDRTENDDECKEISWEEFSQEFEEKTLVGIYSTDGSGIDRSSRSKSETRATTRIRARNDRSTTDHSTGLSASGRPFSPRNASRPQDDERIIPPASSLCIQPTFARILPGVRFRANHLLQPQSISRCMVYECYS